MSIAPSRDEIDSYGHSAARTHYGAISIAYVQLGVQLFMVVYGLSIFLETPKELRNGRGRFILFSFAILITSALSNAFDGWKVFRNLYNGGPTGVEYMSAWQQDHTGENVAPGIVGDTMLVTNIALGDIILLWRCFVLWKDKKWVMVVPSLTCIVSIVFGAIAIVPASRLQFLPVGLTPVISTTLSVAMNLMVTSLILYRLLRVRRKMARLLSGHEHPTLYSDVVTVLIESAIPLAFFGVCFVIATFVLVYRPMRLGPRAGVYAFEEVVATLYYTFASLSPLMIIFRVTTGRSFQNGNDCSQGAGAFSRPIQFAHPIDRRSSMSSDASRGLSPSEGRRGSEVEMGFK